MTIRNLVLDVGYGADVQVASGNMLINRFTASADDTGTWIFDTPVAVVLTNPAGIIPLEVGVAYKFAPSTPPGDTIYAYMTAGAGDLSYQDLVSVDPATLAPDAVPPAAWTTALASTDATVALKANTADVYSKTAADGKYEAGDSKTIYVSATGDDAASGKTVSTAKLTISAALTAMGANPGTIILGNGTISAGASVAWPSTAKCGMVGQGKANTIIQAVAQTGPVIDLSTAGGYNLQDTEFGGFTIWGDNTAGATKKGLALSPTTPLVRANVHDIAVRYTGGACFDLGTSELSDFDRLTAYEPVSAAASDIPYVMATGAFNGNRIIGLQLYGTSVGANVGVSGAVVIKADATYAPGSNEFIAPVAENLHLGTGATIFAFAGNTNTYTDFQFFDNSKIVGATGTSFIRLTDPTISPSGGNLIRGYIPGRGTSTTAIDTGIDMQQSRNQIMGVKGYKGYNVTLAAGVGNTFVMLGGAEAVASDPAVVDNSSVTTNVWWDHYLRTFRNGPWKWTENNTGPTISGGATPANGFVGLGTSGASIQAVGVNTYVGGDNVYFRNVAQTAGVVASFTMSATASGLTLADHTGALPTATSGLRGKIAVKFGASGVADRLVVCRKDAADVYAWVDLY